MENKKTKKDFIKKYSDIFVVVFIFLIITGISIYVSFECDDELWNFANIYKMTQGFTIYKDMNVIITPLFFFIGNIFLKLLGTNLLVFRIYNSVIYTTLLFLIYKIMTTMKIKKINALAYTLIIIFMLKINIKGGANYTILAMCFYLLGCLINLKYENKYLPYIQGIIGSAVFLIKQNIGVYYFVAIFLMHLFYALKEKNVKQEIIKFLKEIMSFLAIILVFMVSMIINGNFLEFIDLCFLGIGEFAFKNISADPKGVIIALVALASIVLSIYAMFSKNIDKKNKEK